MHCFQYPLSTEGFEAERGTYMHLKWDTYHEFTAAGVGLRGGPIGCEVGIESIFTCCKSSLPFLLLWEESLICSILDDVYACLLIPFK